MRILAIKRHGPPLYNVDPLVDHIYKPEDRIEMIRRAHYLVAAAPLTNETRGMIAQPEFDAMRSEAVVINIGRGPVVDEVALVRALTEKRIRGAALDVFDKEPLPDGHPFYKLPNVLLSPHCADHTPDWTEQAMRFFLAQFERYNSGQPLQNVVKKELGY
jgi:phosphoglycerate dehydrogenase-like enzyme